MRVVLIILFVAIALPSCLFVKAPDEKFDVQNVALSPQPEIPMSDDLVRTRAGDLIALLPRSWVFLDTKNEASAEIISVAVNPDYTLTMVVSAIPGAESSKESIESDGLLGLARATFQKHVRKTGGQAKLVGSYRIAQLGARRFAAFDFSTNGGSLRTRCAVCVSSLGNSYEIALAPLTVTGKDVPDPLEQERVFRSILATVQY